MRRLVFLFLLTALLAGCALPSVPNGPTPWPEDYIPTVIVLTAAAAPTQVVPTRVAPTVTASDFPTAIATATATSEPAGPPSPTLTLDPGLVAATVTETPFPQPDPNSATIDMRAPGPESKVVSPIQLRALVQPGANGRIQVELLGEDGRLLARQVLVQYPARENGWVLVKIEIPFEIRAAAERGRLQILTYDDRQRPQAALAVHLLLQSAGYNQITPGLGEYERVTLIEPERGVSAHGGVLTVRGDFQPLSDQLLILELLDEKGNPIAVRQLPGVAGPFETTLEYRTSKAINARLVLRQADSGQILGLVYLFSRALWLYP